jgi:hypothetical protein
MEYWAELCAQITATNCPPVRPLQKQQNNAIQYRRNKKQRHRPKQSERPTRRGSAAEERSGLAAAIRMMGWLRRSLTAVARAVRLGCNPGAVLGVDSISKENCTVLGAALTKGNSILRRILEKIGADQERQWLGLGLGLALYICRYI